MNDDTMNEMAYDPAEHVMIDIETLGTKPGSVVFSVGAVPFSADGVEEGERWVMGVQDQLNMGLTVDADTLAWWLKRAKSGEAEVLMRALGAPDPMERVEMWARLRDWIGEDTVVWANGPDFDLRCLEALKWTFTKTYETPWRYWNCRCFRTWRKVLGWGKPDNGHDALEDARKQAEVVAMWLGSERGAR